MNRKLICSVDGCGGEWSYWAATVSGRRIDREQVYCDYHKDRVKDLFQIAPPTLVGQTDDSSTAVTADVEFLCIDLLHNKRMMLIRELAGDRHFMIEIGEYEMANLHASCYPIISSRPLTYSLLISSIVALGGTIQYVAINQYNPATYTFLAAIVVKQGCDVILIDSRPSDAVIVAIHANCRIVVAQDVFLSLQSTRWRGAGS